MRVVARSNVARLAPRTFHRVRVPSFSAALAYYRGHLGRVFTFGAGVAGRSETQRAALEHTGKVVQEGKIPVCGRHRRRPTHRFVRDEVSRVSVT